MAKEEVINPGKRPYEAGKNPAIWSFLHITIYHKITAALTAVLFLFNIIGTDLAWALRDETSPVIASPAKRGEAIPLRGGFALSIENFSLPSSLGSIKDKHKGQNGTLIYIQDAHCNYSAQKAIAEIIGHLNETYGVDLVNLEGGAGDYHLGLFTDIEDKAKRERVADYFVKEGRVSGAEYFAINNPERVTLFGAEDEGLYIKNLNVYRDSLKYIADINNTLNARISDLEESKKTTYPETLLRLDTEYRRFKEDELELKGFIEYLFKFSLEKGMSLKEFPNVRAIYEAISKEREIDFNKANSERDRLIEELKEILSLNSIDELTLKTYLFKSGQLSDAAYYNYLKDIAKRHSVDLTSKPNLSNYIVYITHYETADKVKVFDEIEDLFELLAKNEFKDEAQERLFWASKHTRILKNIFNIKATKNEINYFNKHKDKFNISDIINSTVIASPSTGSGRSNLNNSDIAAIDIRLNEFLKFYKYAEARDEAFIKNIAKSHERFNKDTSIIVAGGFHEENLTSLFKKNGFSYIVIRPNFQNGDGYDCPYYKLLSGGLSEIETKVVEAISAIALASFLNGLGVKVHGENARVLFELALRLHRGDRLVLKTRNNGTLEIALVNGEIVQQPATAKTVDVMIDETGILALGKKAEMPAETHEKPAAEPERPKTPGIGPIANLILTFAALLASSTGLFAVETIKEVVPSAVLGWVWLVAIGAAVAGGIIYGVYKFIKSRRPTGTPSPGESAILPSEPSHIVEEAYRFLTHNPRVSSAVTEKYGIHLAMERLGKGQDIVMVTAEPSAYSDLNDMYGHTNVDSIADEFGKASFEFINKNMPPQGIEFTAYYNPYGGRWQFIFSVDKGYDESKFEDFLNDMLKEAISSARAKEEVVQIELGLEVPQVFNAIASISRPQGKDVESKEFLEKTRKALLDALFGVKRRVGYFRIRTNQKIRRWISLTQKSPPGELQEAVRKIAKEIAEDPAEFKKKILSNAKSEYYKSLLSKANDECNSLIVYAENEFYPTQQDGNFLALTSRERRPQTIFAYKLPENFRKTFFFDEDINKWLKDYTGKLKYFAFPRYVINYSSLEEEKSALIRDIESVDKPQIDSFVTKILNLSLESEYGVPQGIGIINTLTKKFVERLSGRDKGIIFRINGDFDYLSRVPRREMADTIKIKGLPIIKRIFEEEFGRLQKRYPNTVLTVIRGGGDEWTVVGYLDGRPEVLAKTVKRAVKRINKLLGNIRFDGKRLRYEVNQKIWQPSISCGFAYATNPEEAGYLDYWAEAACRHSKERGRRKATSFEELPQEARAKKATEESKLEPSIPEELLPYAKSIRKLTAVIESMPPVTKPLAKAEYIKIERRDEGYWLNINGERRPGIVGMVYQPAGENPYDTYIYPCKYDVLYSALLDPEEDKDVLDKIRGKEKREDVRGQSHAKALKAMNVDVIRTYYVPIQNKTEIENIKLIFNRLYEGYGIRVMIGSYAGQYFNPVTLHPATEKDRLSTDNRAFREDVKRSVERMVEIYGNEPWVFGFTLGNEPNYYIYDGNLRNPKEPWACIDMSLEELFTFMGELADIAKKKAEETGVNRPVVLGLGGELEDYELIGRLIEERCRNFDAVAVTLYLTPDEYKERITLLQNHLKRPLFISEYGRSTPDNAYESHKEYFPGALGNLSDCVADPKNPLLGAFLFEFTDEPWKRGDQWHSPNGLECNGNFGVFNKPIQKKIKKGFKALQKRIRKAAIKSRRAVETLREKFSPTYSEDEFRTNTLLHIIDRQATLLADNLMQKEVAIGIKDGKEQRMKLADKDTYDVIVEPVFGAWLQIPKPTFLLLNYYIKERKIHIFGKEYRVEKVDSDTIHLNDGSAIDIMSALAVLLLQEAGEDKAIQVIPDGGAGYILLNSNIHLYLNRWDERNHIWHLTKFINSKLVKEVELGYQVISGFDDLSIDKLDERMKIGKAQEAKAGDIIELARSVKLSLKKDENGDFILVDENGRSFKLNQGANRIGRSSKDQDIQLEESAVSKRHAVVVVGAEKVLVYDLGSANGTEVLPPGTPPLAADGMIARGSPERLRDELMRQGVAEFRDDPALPRVSSVIESLKTRIKGSGIEEKDKTRLLNELDKFSRSLENGEVDVKEFSAVTLEDEAYRMEAKDWKRPAGWLLGFNTMPRAPDAQRDELLNTLQQMILDRLQKHTLGLATEVLDIIHAKFLEAELPLQKLNNVKRLITAGNFKKAEDILIRGGFFSRDAFMKLFQGYESNKEKKEALLVDLNGRIKSYEGERDRAKALLGEYIFHEVLCPIFGHYETRKFQERIFTKNYEGVNGEEGKRDGRLTLILKRVMYTSRFMKGLPGVIKKAYEIKQRADREARGKVHINKDHENYGEEIVDARKRLEGAFPSIFLRKSVAELLYEVDKNLKEVGLYLYLRDGLRSRRGQAFIKKKYIEENPDKKKTVYELLEHANKRFSDAEPNAPHLSGGAFDIEIREVGTKRPIFSKEWQVFLKRKDLFNGEEESQWDEKVSGLFKLATEIGYKDVEDYAANTPHPDARLMILLRNRRLLCNLLTGFGSTAHPYEHWHYGYKTGDRTSAIFSNPGDEAKQEAYYELYELELPQYEWVGDIWLEDEKKEGEEDKISKKDIREKLQDLRLNDEIINFIIENIDNIIFALSKEKIMELLENIQARSPPLLEENLKTSLYNELLELKNECVSAAVWQLAKNKGRDKPPEDRISWEFLRNKFSSNIGEVKLLPQEGITKTGGEGECIYYGNNLVISEEYYRDNLTPEFDALEELTRVAALPKAEPTRTRVSIGEKAGYVPINKYLTDINGAIMRQPVLDLKNGEAAGRGLLGAMSNGLVNGGLKREPKYIAIVGGEKALPALVAGEGIDNNATRDIQETIELFRSQGYTNLTIITARSSDELKTKYPNLPIASTFIYWEGRPEGEDRGFTPEEVRGAFSGYLSARLDIPSEGGFLSIEGLVALALGVMDLKQTGAREEMLGHIYNLLAALQMTDVDRIRQIWESKGWHKEPMNAFILSDKNKDILTISIMPIEIDADLKEYYKREREFVTAL